MSGNWKRPVLAGIYALVMAGMTTSLSLEVLRPKAHANACPNEGQPCNLTIGGSYACTGGINGGPPIPGCTCDIANFCTGETK